VLRAAELVQHVAHLGTGVVIFKILEKNGNFDSNCCYLIW
jgi:hypothetical protein